MSIKPAYPHIVLDAREQPTIEGTSLKVVELVLEKAAYGWSPEELQFQHPYLTLGQIHAALAYYFDHAEEMDREIAQRAERGEVLRRTLESRTQALREKLRSADVR